ncbi:MAG: DciA family protein [Defluviicoccus sp.]
MSVKPTQRRGGFRALAETVAVLTRPIVGKRGFVSEAIVSGWETIVGQRLSPHVMPERISYPRGRQAGGTLHLRLATGALATELQHLEPRIIERINAVFGFPAVARMKVIHAPLPVGEHSGQARLRPPPPPPLAPRIAETLAADLAGISDPGLQAALFALGSAILAEQAAPPAATDTPTPESDRPRQP